LSTRFKPEVGLIRSWDHGAWKYPVIIDNMMNLELLTWAAREANEPRLREIAIGHADNTRKNHFRPDASTWHVLDYNPTNGAVVKRQTHQGAADDSAWARGQAWGLYGYTMMYRETRRPEYLEQAVKIAQFLLSHPRLPADKVPYWDFDAPGIPNAPRDASAAAIMASALLELGTLAEPAFARQCFETARQQLRSLASPAYRAVVGENGGFLLRHCVGHFPKNSEVDVPINYADYYFLEALLRLRKQVSATGTAPASSPQASVKKTKRSQGDAGSRPQRKAADLRIQPAPALPNVLLLGDSISIGYTLPVRDRLRGEANVFRPVTAAGAAENCADTGKGLAELDRWLAAQPKWDIIHFNWGLHDLKHMKPGAPTPTTSADPNDPPLRTVEEYQANLEKIVTRLRQTGARLVFATTTPVPEGVTNPYRNPEDPARYNAAAAEVMKRHGIRVNDLFSFAQPRLAEIQLSRNVHFTPQGSEAMAKQVAEAIQSELKVQVRPAAVSRP
jgi:lysophospholipase L1-like esterase